MKYKSLSVLSVGPCEYQRTCVGSTCEHHDKISYAYFLEHRRTQAPGQGCTNDDGDVPCSLTVSWGHAMSLLDPMVWNVFESLNVSPVFSSIALQMNEQH